MEIFHSFVGFQKKKTLNHRTEWAMASIARNQQMVRYLGDPKVATVSG
jgi:hypothetical protein